MNLLFFICMQIFLSLFLSQRPIETMGVHPFISHHPSNSSTLSSKSQLYGACTSFHAPREQRSKGALLEHNSRAKDVRGAKEQRSKGAKEQRKIKSAPMQREHWSKGAKEQRSIVAPRMTQDDSG